MRNKQSLNAVFPTLSFLLGFMLAGCTTTPSHQYPAGTVGSLYEECRDAVQYNHTPQEYLKTECYQFSLNWAMGGFSASMINHGNPNDYQVSDPSCAAQIEAESRYLQNAAFCRKQNGKAVYGYTEVSLGYQIARWGEWLEFYDRDMLAKPVFPYINSAFSNGPFCKYILDTNVRNTSIKPSKTLANASSVEWKEAEEIWKKNTKDNGGIFFGENPSPDGYKNCLRDIERANGDPLLFNGTPCGKEMSATLSGMFITDVVDENQSAKDNCTADRENFYKYAILAKHACLTKDMNILDFTIDTLAGYTYDPATDQVEKKKDYSFDYCKVQTLQ